MILALLAQVDVTFFENLPKTDRQTLWSSWGDGCLASNGKYYTSIGDHLGANATARVYEYDPETKALKLLVDVAQAIGQKEGQYGHGKIHSGIHEARDGWLYFTTYWGKQREIDAAYQKGYEGSILMRVDPKSGRAENWGAIAPRRGLPASAFDPERNLLFFHAVYQGEIVAYDLGEKKIKFMGGAGETDGQRTFLRDQKGRVYFTATGGALHYYDPDANAVGKTKAVLPGGEALRAAARPAKNGVVYGMTQRGKIFAFDPAAETVRDMGPNHADGIYTAVMAISPDDRFLYFVPGAHGNSGKFGTPVVQVDVASGERKTLISLFESVKRDHQYELGGTYNLQLDGKRLFMTFNGGDKGFGRPSVVVVTLP